MRTSLILASVCLVGLFGCAVDSESEGGSGLPNKPLSGNGQAVGDPQPEEARIAKADNSLPSSGSTSATCRQGAFCEGFESAGYASNWNSSWTTNDGEISLGGDSASLGKGSLHLSTRDKDSTAYLLREAGPVGAQWNGSLSFAIRVGELPGSYLGGPEITVKTPNGPVYVRVFVTPDGLFLEQNGSPSCPVDRCTGSRKLISTVFANHWYNVVVGFEVNARDSAPYGLVETSVNGGQFETSELTVPISEGSLFLKAGITAGDVGRTAAIDLDDVSLLVR